jgi:hypothetical protein
MSERDPAGATPTPDLASGPDEPRAMPSCSLVEASDASQCSLNGASMARTYDRRGPKGRNGLGQETR